MGYEALIDAETWAFIRATEAWYPADAAHRSIAEQRDLYTAMCRAFFQGYPEGVRAHDTGLGGVPVRRYGGQGATVLYFHGGGFVVGGLESHDDICAELCARTGLEVISVDYRLAPEHRHPAMVEDALAATGAALALGPVILVGDSAGGALAAAVAHRMRAAPGLRGQVLIYPGLGGDLDRGSAVIHAEAPMLTRADVLFYQGIRCDGPAPVGDPSFAPLQDRDFAGLPPSVIVTAQCDPLSDDGRDYRDRVLAAGGKAAWIEEPGLVHGYLRARSTVARARASFDRIVAAIDGLARGEWPVA